LDAANLNQWELSKPLLFTKLKENKMESAIQSLFIDLHKMQLKLYPLEAVWFDRPVQMPDGKKARITKGDVIRIEDGKIVDCLKWEHATHVVTGGKGRIDSSELYLDVTNLDTNESFTLKIN
jgi:hypothetical protein